MAFAYLDHGAWQTMLNREGWAGYLALVPEHIFLQSGLIMPLHMHTNPRIPSAVLATAERTALVVPRIQLSYLAQAEVQADIVVTFGEFDLRAAQASDSDEAAGLRREMEREHRSRTWTDGIALASRLLGVAGERLGYDETALTEGNAEALRKVLHAPLVSGSDGFRRVRRVKPAAAVEVLRRALLIAEESLVETVAAARPGVTQQTLHGIYRAAVGRRGATPVHVGIGIGDSAVLPINRPLAKPLRAGDLIRLDVGVLYDGFLADTCRMVSIGVPSSRTLRTYSALQTGEAAAVRAVAEGATTAEIFEAGVAPVREMISDYDRPHIGHAIGVHRYEAPLIAPVPNERIGVGEVLNVEVPFYDFVQGGFNVEDTVVVGHDGVRVLNVLPRELVDAQEYVQSTEAARVAARH
jgi:Xaa-Pro aminopeptidase